MFIGARLDKRVNMGSGGRSRVNGEGSAGNTARTYLVDTYQMKDYGKLYANSHPKAVELDSEMGRAISLVNRPNSGLDRAVRERSTTSSLSSPPLSPIDQENGNGIIPLNGNESIFTQKETEGFDLDK